MTTACPHCKHSWNAHTPNCMACGCMWTNPADAPEPPPPPSGREQLIANIEHVIWTELERQSETERFGPYVDREMAMVDASGSGLNMTTVAAAVANLFVDSQDDCSWCHSCTAISGWKQPIESVEDDR